MTIGSPWLAGHEPGQPAMGDVLTAHANKYKATEIGGLFFTA